MLIQELVELSKSDVPALLNVGFKLMDYISQGWNYYVVISGVMVGWRFSAKEQWTNMHKIIVTGLYSLFAIVNFLGLYMAYSSLNKIFLDLNIAAKTLDARTPQLKQLLESTYLTGGIPLTVLVYLTAFLLVMCCVWFVKYGASSK